MAWIATYVLELGVGSLDLKLLVPYSINSKGRHAGRREWTDRQRPDYEDLLSHVKDIGFSLEAEWVT